MKMLIRLMIAIAAIAMLVLPSTREAAAVPSASIDEVSAETVTYKAPTWTAVRRLARTCHIALADLRALNPRAGPVLAPGERVQLPKPDRVWTVRKQRPAQNLTKISACAGMNVDAVLALPANREYRPNPNLIRIGDQIEFAPRPVPRPPPRAERQPSPAGPWQVPEPDPWRMAGFALLGLVLTVPALAAGYAAGRRGIRRSPKAPTHTEG